MAAFDFPSPPVEDGFEVKNELTGITYKYDAASGSWVVVASNVQDNYYTKPEVDTLLQSVSPDLIWENTNPPLPDTPYKLWYNTDTLELYFYYCDTNGVCAWTPTSVPLTALEVITTELDITNAMVASVERLASANFSELQQIQANLGQVTLQEVLDNGNVADKGATFGDRLTVERPALGQNTSLNVKGGIRDDDNNLTIGSMLRAYHDASDLAKDSGVEYKGKIYNSNNLVNKGYVDGANAEQDEVINNNASDIGAIQDRIEDLERIRTTGKWKATDGIVSTPPQGQFNLVTSGGSSELVRNWPDAKVLNIASEDLNGVYHSLAGWEEGDKIEIISDTETQSWATYTIGPAVPGSRDTMLSLASCDSSNGIPINRFDYRIRYYENAAIDLDQADERYVNIAGDTMTGALKTTSIELSKSSFITTKSNGSTLWSYGTADSGEMGTFVVGSGKEFKMGTGSAQSFKIYADSKCRVSNLKDPVSDLDATHRKYVQDEIAKAANTHWGWTFKPGISGSNLRAGQFNGESDPDWNNGNKYTYFFHKEALNGKQMDFYKNYHQYFGMGHMTGSFWYLDTGANTWKMKGMFFIRDLWFGYSVTSPHLFALQTHSDFDDTEHSKWPDTLFDNTAYYLKIGGIL